MKVPSNTLSNQSKFSRSPPMQLLVPLARSYTVNGLRLNDRERAKSDERVLFCSHQGEGQPEHLESRHPRADTPRR